MICAVLEPNTPTAVGAPPNISGCTCVLKLTASTLAKHSGSVLPLFVLAIDVEKALLCILEASIRFEMFTVFRADVDVAGVVATLVALRHGVCSAFEIEGHRSVATDAIFFFNVSI